MKMRLLCRFCGLRTLSEWQGEAIDAAKSM